jgi:hypothetical protein
MPRENRKRGKKHKKNEEQEQPHAAIGLAQVSQNDPSWIKPSLRDMDDPESEAPFGLLDADVKAYFRTVDIQIRDWQEDQEATGDDHVDPNESAYFCHAMKINRNLIFRNHNRKAIVFYGRIERNAGKGKAASYGCRMLYHTREDALLYG